MLIIPTSSHCCIVRCTWIWISHYRREFNCTPNCFYLKRHQGADPQYWVPLSKTRETVAITENYLATSYKPRNCPWISSETPSPWIEVSPFGQNFTDTYRRYLWNNYQSRILFSQFYKMGHLIFLQDISSTPACFQLGLSNLRCPPWTTSLTSVSNLHSIVAILCIW